LKNLAADNEKSISMKKMDVKKGRKMKWIESERISFSISIRIRADCPEFTITAVMPVRLGSKVLG